MTHQLAPLDLSNVTSRDAIVAQVKALSPNLDDVVVSPLRGGREAAMARLEALDPQGYGKTRNHLDGAVTQLSAYIRHGVVSPVDVRDRALDQVDGKRAEKFIQQLAWRDYWHVLYAAHPERVWTDMEGYKTGFTARDYADDLPEDVACGETGVAVIDYFIGQLLATGWLHNRARLYIAAYVCHWRRVKWQAGAQWFLTHLLDGDPASNNFSWQWVASTFSHKPYYFNLENVQNFTGPEVDTAFNRNKDLAGSYEDIAAKLFPHLEAKP